MCIRDSLDVVDFALRKVIASPTAPFAVGDTITYAIEVINQGTVTGNNLVIYDHAPIGLTFDPSINSGWFAGVGAAGDSTIISTPLLPGTSTTVSVSLIVNNLGGGVEDYTNFAEIGSVEDEDGNDISALDQDSTPDDTCLLYTSPSPRDATLSRMPSSA